MFDRITKNEERFDKILNSVKEMEIALTNFVNVQKDLTLLKKYYESKNWIKDKDKYEKIKTPKIKAGVLSEDGVWNMLENIDEIKKDMKKIVEL